MFELAVVVAIILAVLALIRLQDATLELRAIRRRLDELEKFRGEFADPLQAVTRRPPSPAGSVTKESERAEPGAAHEVLPTVPATGEGETEDKPSAAGVGEIEQPTQPSTESEPERESPPDEIPSPRPLAPLPASLRRETPPAPLRRDDDEPLPVVGRHRSSEDEWAWLRAKEVEDTESPEDSSSFEARVGSTWLLRIGLVFLVLAAALFAIVVTPRVGPGGKVALGYVFAGLLFGAGKLSGRLRNFSRPVMAGGLSIAFFVSYAAYFIEPMRCMPAPASLSLMGVSVAAILFFSDRWRSEYTGGLAVFLGHAATFVAGRNLEAGGPASLVAVVFLSVAAVVLLIRHSWAVLSLFAVVAAYGSHLLWASVAESVATAEQALYVNLAFLSSYYVIFACADLLWWRRRTAIGSGEGEDVPQKESGAPGVATTLGPALAPLNLVLYTSIVSFLYLETEVYLGTIHYFFFTLAAVQAVLGVLHRSSGGQRYLFYPAAATVLLTLGFFSAFERLALNLVLAAEAMVLLVVAHQTRLRLFHLLSQAALAANFIHYWIYASTIDPTRARFIGGMLTAAVYLVKSSLEESWYGPGSTFAWIERRPASKFFRELSDAFDRAYGLLTPILPHLHAAGGAMILVHQCGQFLTPLDAGWVLVAGMLGFAALGAAFGSAPLLLASTLVYAGALTLQGFEPGTLLLRISPEFPAASRAGINGAGAWAALLACAVLSVRRNAWARPRYGLLVWPITTLLLFLFAYPSSPMGEPASGAPFLVWLAALFAGMGALERMSAFQGRRRPGGATAMGVMVLEVLAGLVLARHLNAHFDWRFAEEPIRFVLLSGVAAALPLIGLVRRSAGVYSSGVALMLLVFTSIFASDPARDALLVSIPATLAVALPLVAVGWTQDLMARLYDELLTPARKRLALPAISLPYVLGMVVLINLVDFHLEEPWRYGGQAGLAVALMFATQPLRLFRGAGLSILFYVAVALVFVMANEGEARDGWPYLAAAGVVIAAGFAMERGWNLGASAIHASRIAGIDPVSAGRIALVLAATAVALTGALQSTVVGVRWATAAWAVYAAAMMIMGFAWRRASYRRTALAVLALCIARVLLVDIRKLETLYQAIALLVLGLCLVAIAWLYSRFSAQLRRWL